MKQKDLYVPFFFVSGRNHFVHALDKDVSLWTNQGAEKNYKVCHRFMNHSTKYTRVEIATRSCDCHLVVRQATETICEGGCTGVQPVIIGLNSPKPS